MPWALRPVGEGAAAARGSMTMGEEDNTTMPSFADLGLPPMLLKSVQDVGYERPSAKAKRNPGPVR